MKLWVIRVINEYKYLRWDRLELSLIRIEWAYCGKLISFRQVRVTFYRFLQWSRHYIWEVRTHALRVLRSFVREAYSYAWVPSFNYPSRAFHPYFVLHLLRHRLWVICTRFTFHEWFQWIPFPFQFSYCRYLIDAIIPWCHTEAFLFWAARFLLLQRPTLLVVLNFRVLVSQFYFDNSDIRKNKISLFR